MVDQLLLSLPLILQKIDALDQITCELLWLDIGFKHVRSVEGAIHKSVMTLVERLEVLEAYVELLCAVAAQDALLCNTWIELQHKMMRLGRW